MQYNRECSYCNSKYYVCRKCIDINSWKNLCCSRECYRKLIEDGATFAPKIIKNEVDNMPTILRAGLVNGKTIDITGYDLELGRFDCSDGTTKQFDSFEYFIISKEEMKVISERINTLIEDNSKNSRNSYGSRNRKSNS